MVHLISIYSLRFKKSFKGDKNYVLVLIISSFRFRPFFPKCNFIRQLWAKTGSNICRRTACNVWYFDCDLSEDEFFIRFLFWDSGYTEDTFRSYWIYRKCKGSSCYGFNVLYSTLCNFLRTFLICPFLFWEWKGVMSWGITYLPVWSRTRLFDLKMVQVIWDSSFLSFSKTICF